MSCFFDTNVLVYLFDRGDSVKRLQAQTLVAEHMRPMAFAKSSTPVGDGAFRLD